MRNSNTSAHWIAHYNKKHFTKGLSVIKKKKSFTFTKTIVLLCLCSYILPINKGFGQCVTQGLINFPFTGNATATITPGAGLSCSSAQTTITSGNGIATTGGAFFANTATDALQISFPALGGNSNSDFTITGSTISKYKTFEVYVQTRRNGGLGSNYTMNMFYSKDGGAFTAFGSGTTVTTTYAAVSFTLPAAVNNPTTSLVIRLQANSNALNTWRVDNFQIRALPDPTAPSTFLNASICSGATATISATPVGTSTITWFSAPTGGSSIGAGNSFSPSTGQGTPPYDNTVSGTYTFYAESNLFTCVSPTRTPVTVTVGPLLTLSPVATPATICEGSNSSLNANILTGSPTFNYSWSPSTFLNSTTSASPTVTNATASTTYTVNVTDACGNTTSGSVSLIVSPLPSISINTSPSPAVICTTGSVSITADGADTYTWTPSTGLSATAGSTVTASPLATTTYMVTGTNGFGCTSTQSVTVNVSPAVNILSTTATPNNPCFNASSQLNAAAANTNSYSLTSIPFGFTSSAGFSSVSLGNDAMSGAIALPFNFSFYGSNYSQIFIGSNGFVQFGSSSGSTNVYGQTLPSVSNPNKIIAGVWADLRPSSGGTITYGTTGSAPNRIFTIQFSGVPFSDQLFTSGGSVTFQIQLKEALNIAEVHVQSVSNALLPSTSVTTLVLKNTNGSAFTAPAGRFNNGNWTVSTPEAWRFTPSGGSYDFAWSPPAFLSATNISNPIAQNITSTTIYTVSASDANGCSATKSVTITIDPISLSCSSSPSGFACFASTVSLQSLTSGGSTPYSYAWSTGALTQNASVIASSPQTYTVTVTDACGNTQTSTVFVDITPLPDITLNPNPSPAIICTSGSVSLTASGADSYTWSPSYGLGSTTGTTVIASPGGTTIYTVTGTAASGCTNTQTATVSYSTPINVTASAAPSIVCPNGSSQLNATGLNNYSVASIPFGFTSPVSPTTVSLGDDAMSGAVTLPFTFNFYGSSYTQIFISSNGFVQFGSNSGSTLVYGQTLPSATPPNAIAAGVWADLDPSAGGTIRRWVTGTTPNRIFTIEYNTIKILGTTLFNTPVTTFQIQLKESGIIEVHIQNVVQPLIPNSTNTTLALKNNAGNVFLGPAGRFNSGNWNISTPEAWRFFPPTPISFTWSPATFLTSTVVSNPLAQNITSAITYTVTASDANGCSATKSVSISVASPLALTCSSIPANLVCAGTTVSLSANPSAGTTPYSYLWSTGATTQNTNITASTSQTYTVTVTDNCGSTLSCEVIVNVSAVPTSVISPNGNISVCPPSTSLLLISSTSAITPAYQWKKNGVNIGGANSPSLTVTTSGSYSVVISDNANTANCSSASAPVNVTFQPSPTVAIATVSNPTVCVGGSQVLSSLSYPASVTFTNSAPISIPLTLFAAANATPYPSALNVSGLSPGAAVASVSINSFSHPALNNVDMVLVSPGGTAVVLMSDVGGNNSISNVNYTFIDGAAAMTGTPPSAGTYNCTNTGASDNFPSPGPGTVTQASPLLSSFTGNPNGTWNLFIVDDNGNLTLQNGSIASWKIVFNNPVMQFSWQIAPPSSISTLSSTNTSSTTATINDTATYIVTVTDPSTGCSASSSITLNTFSKPKPYLLEGDSVLCSNDEGFNMHVLDADAFSSGYPAGTIFDFYGAGAILYQNGTSNTFFNANNTDAFYAVVTLPGYLGNCSGLSDTSVIDFGSTQAPQYNLTTDSVKCYGDASGKAIAQIMFGGTQGFRWQWYNSSNVLVRDVTDTAHVDTLSGMPQGMYTLVLTDHQGSLTSPHCSITDSIIISQSSAALSVSDNTLNHINILCNGNSTGSIDINVAGGTIPYSYNWSNGAVTQDINGLTAGTYSCTITDSRGCVVTTGIAITEPLELALNPAIGDVLCHGGTGSIVANINGGVSPYSYNWSNGINTQSNSGIATGTYTVTVADANGCTLSSSCTVNEPGELSVNCTSTNNSCFNSNNGTINTAVTGGTAPYFYLWSNSSLNASLNSLAVGNYTVTVYDYHGCSTQCSSTITQPSLLTTSVVSVTNPTSALPATGVININVNGGTPGYSYLWNNGSITQNRTGLSAGTYTVTVTDTHGCTVSISSTLQVICTLGYSNQVVQQPSCGKSNGIATVTASGGTSYTYSWQTIPVQTTATATGLAYYNNSLVLITDVSGCSRWDTVVLPTSNGLVLTLTSPVFAGGYNIRCNGGNTGSISLTVGGSTGPYSYLWNNGATTQNLTGLSSGTYIVTVSNGGCTNMNLITLTQPSVLVTTVSKVDPACFGGSSGTATVTAGGGAAPYTYSWNTSPVKTSATASGLSAGVYTVTVSDANGCTKTAMVTLSQPTTMALTGVATNVNCNGGTNGSIDITIAGGTPPYTYLWTGGATIQDRINVLAAGTYTVTVTDSKGCTIQYSSSVTQPTATTATSTSTNVSCFGGTNGTGSVIASGGTPPYTYSWNSVPAKTGASVTGLKKGLYTVIITDSHGCLKGININITEPPAINISIAKVNVSIPGGNNGSATANVSGGVSPYSYSWNTVPVKTSQTASGLIAGTYTVTVTDVNGCTKTASVVITQPSSRMAGDIQNNTVSNSVVYPNPSTGKFTVSFDETIRTIVSLKIYSLTGESVFIKDIKVSDNESSFDMDLSELPKGLYLMHYHTKDKAWIEKISIE